MTATGRDATLVLDALARRYADTVAVESISLHVPRGEIVCLLGPSGCGKTTTLRMIGGFVEPSAGRILLDGVDVTRVPAHRRNIGIVFQSYALFPHLSVAANVGFGLDSLRWDPARRDRKVAEMLDLVELGPLAQRMPRALSGGQQQRVALARALALEPAVLLLDEPFSNLDAQLRLRMREEMRALLRRLGITTVFVTHDQEEALSLADRIVVMNRGRVEQVGTPAELYDRPGSPFVASFIGIASLVAGRVDGGLFHGPGGLVFAVAQAAPGPATAVIRPEHVGLDAAGTPATVVSKRYLGPVVRTTVTIGDAQIALDIEPAAAQGLEPGIGTGIRVRADACAVLTGAGP